ncbi:ADP-ribosylglycohydrolase family protein [Paenibacillus lentus]|uniref:ADP-ribosylglycohydrolase family protein n=1 Tax=Paenibacillus lentus TaxID=1338368 RepID=A0A3Q8SE26_9BACL|nr:ADP-ribosylglycohydrolase family protein [Paenibacillus lentus]AZK48549.1 ADP-ribosylglycohydrolase family protein [Paenibacillus lentus]
MNGKRMIDRWQDDNEIFLRLAVKKRVLPTLYGAVIGDMLGVPVEFQKRGTFQISDVTGYGTYNQPPGTWSDDTSLTLCLIENIIEKSDEEGLMRKFVQYRDRGNWTPHNQMFDIGRTTSEAITKYKLGSAPSECGGTQQYDNGNGALMRIAPLVFILFNNFNFMEKVHTIKKYTEITHAHPRSIVGSIIYIEFLIRLYYNNSPEESRWEIKKLFDENFEDEHIYRKELQHYSRIFDENFFLLPPDEIFSSGYVVHTLEAALWCLGSTNSYREAVLKAVNLGEDTDTVAAITGALAGMNYKMEGIPEEWLAKIARKENIDELLEKFYHFCGDKAVEEEYGH